MSRDLATSQIAVPATPVAATDAASKSYVDAVTIDQVTPTTTKGDLLVDDGADVVRLPVGTDGQVLESRAAAATGVQWVAAAAAGVTEISDSLTTDWGGAIPDTAGIIRIRKIGDVVTLRFVDVSGTVDTATTIRSLTALDPAYWPATNNRFVRLSSAGTGNFAASFVVGANGIVTVSETANGDPFTIGILGGFLATSVTYLTV